MLLLDLQARLQRDGKTMEEFGFEGPGAPPSELQLELERYDADEQKSIASQLRDSFELTDEQSTAVEAILEAVSNTNTQDRWFAIHGIAGSGKTSIAQLLAAEVRSRGKIVKICAATTLASQLYEDASTAHSLWKYPVIDENEIDIESPPFCT
jgi:RecG-like helicase